MLKKVKQLALSEGSEGSSNTWIDGFAYENIPALPGPARTQAGVLLRATAKQSQDILPIRLLDMVFENRVNTLELWGQVLPCSWGDSSPVSRVQRQLSRVRKALWAMDQPLKCLKHL